MDKICPMYKAAILANPDKDYNIEDLNKLEYIQCDGAACMWWTLTEHVEDGHCRRDNG